MYLFRRSIADSSKERQRLPMSDFLNRLTRRIEARSSRRGFFTTMGKVVAGMAAAMVGGGIFSESNANAAPNSLLCCSGSECYNDQCSSSEYVGYTWCCRIYSDNPNYMRHGHKSSSGLEKGFESDTEIEVVFKAIH
jgi:hypothetical protein